MRCLVLLGLVGCGTDRVPALFDAPPPGTPLVTVTAPRLNEAFYATQAITIEWSAIDDDASLVCAVRASDGTAMHVIATDVAAAPGTAASATWTPAGVAPSASYRAEVTCTDPGGLIGSDVSGTFAITEPPQPVDYATQVQPILTASCTSAQCHDATNPQEALDLTAANAYAELVGVASRQCPTNLLVEPNTPSESYLVIKLQGAGSCFKGTRMPKPPESISAAELQLVRDWIANGAPRNCTNTSHVTGHMACEVSSP
jgi:hypothetical protein